MKNCSLILAGYSLIACLLLQACTTSSTSDSLPLRPQEQTSATHPQPEPEPLQVLSLERRIAMLATADQLDQQARRLEAAARDRTFASASASSFADALASAAASMSGALAGAGSAIRDDAAGTVEIGSLRAHAASLREQAYAGLDRGASNSVPAIVAQADPDESVGSSSIPSIYHDLIGKNELLESLLQQHMTDGAKSIAFRPLIDTPPGPALPIPAAPSTIESGTTKDAASTGAPAPALPAAPSPATILATESEKINRLVRGSAAVSAPSRATQGESFTVHLRVSPNRLGAVMQGLKEEFPENQTVKGKPGIQLTPRMTASVAGMGFEIVTNGAQTQAVSATEPTTWSWEVKPLEAGLHTLTFTLSGFLSIEEKEVSRNFYQYVQKVDVEVDPGGFMQQHWQWLLTTLAMPLGAALWAWLRKPPRRTGPAQENAS